jgi:hypothetical protein
MRLLRSKLEKIDRTKTYEESKAKRTAPLDIVKALIDNEDLSGEELKKALVMGILSDELGGQFVNDPGFSNIAEKITKMLIQDEAVNVLLDRAISVLGETPG